MLGLHPQPGVALAALLVEIGLEWISPT